MKLPGLFGPLLLVLIPAMARGETLASYDSLNDDPLLLQLKPSDWAAGVQPPSLLQVSPGLTRVGGKGLLLYGGWDTAINPSKYVGFSISAQPGYRLYIDGLNHFTSYSRFDGTNALSSLVWAYRIDDDGDGVFEKDWTFGKTYTPADGDAFVEPVIKDWDFVGNNCRTKGTIQFAIFASAAAPTGCLTAFEDGLTVEGTAIPIGPLAAMHYNASYDLDVSEASAVAWRRDSDTLFSIGDEGTELVELSKTGQRLSSMPFDQSGKSETRPLNDPEGICWLGGKQFVISDERRNLGVVITYDPATTPTLAQVAPTSYAFGPPDSNNGLEGVTYDPVNDSLWGIRERAPTKIYEMPHYASSVSKGGQVVVNEPIENRRIAQAGISQLSDIYCMALSRRFPEGNPRHLDFLLLSRDGRRVMEIDRQGRAVDSLDLSFLRIGTIEGITMDDAGNLYLVSEQVPGSFAPQLHVFSPSAPEVEWPADKVQDYADFSDALGEIGAVPQLALLNADFSKAIDANASQGKADVLAHPENYNLFTESSIQDLRGTGTLIRMTGDNVTLSLPLETTADLGADSWTDTGVKMEATLPKTADKAFFRLTLPEK
jgi:uncharacterized protein YjiK